MFQSEWTGGANGGTVVAVGAWAFGFQVPVANGGYTVRLHFAELNKTAANTRTSHRCPAFSGPWDRDRSPWS